MSFRFDWHTLNISLEKVNALLARSGTKPPAIVGQTVVRSLDLGKVSPKVDLIDIKKISDTDFKGTFHIEYQGNAQACLETMVEVC